MGEYGPKLNGKRCSASLQNIMSIRAIDPVWSQAIFPMRVTLFPFGMPCVTNTPPINGNNTLSCSELNGKHAGDGSMSLRFIIFEIC